MAKTVGLRSHGKPWLCAARRPKINSFDPPSATVCTAYPTPPFLPFFHPPIELTSRRPRGCLDLDRWINSSAIHFRKLLHVLVAEIHN
jgi:hypothetical protein